MKEETLSPATPVFQTVITVLPTDADEFEHANNTRYIHWMQQVAIEHSTALGWDAQRYQENRTMWAVRRHIVDYIHPVYPGEKMLAETWVTEMKNVSCIRKYRFTREKDGLLIAKAETCWAYISLDTGKPVRVPEDIKKLFAPPALEK